MCGVLIRREKFLSAIHTQGRRNVKTEAEME